MNDKLKRNLMVDHANKIIIMSADFARKSANTESPEYTHLSNVKSLYSDYRIKRRTIKKKPNKESYKGLTYDFMENHILTYDPSSITEYQQMRYMAECHSVRYPAIKKWFLDKYPEIKTYGVLYNQNAPSKKAS